MPFVLKGTSRNRAGQIRTTLNPLLSGLQSLHHGLVLGVGLPCQVMDCGDVVYRSTLPKQGIILTAPGVLLSLLVATYLWAQPGVAPGFWDMFVLAKLDQFIRPSDKKVGTATLPLLQGIASGVAMASSWNHQLPSLYRLQSVSWRGCHRGATVCRGRRHCLALGLQYSCRPCSSLLCTSSSKLKIVAAAASDIAIHSPDLSFSVTGRRGPTTTGRLMEITPWRGRAVCALTKEKQQATTEEPANLEKEAHKYFDQVVITVRAGDGGHGSVLDMPVAPAAPRYKPGDKHAQQSKNNEKGKRKTGVLKRGSDGSLHLPMGGHGADVILVADETIDSLLEFHKKKRFNGKRGGNVNASGPLTAAVQEGLSAPTLLISVPVGTVVKRKKGGKLLADLSRVGDKYLVARGGNGGISVLEAPKKSRRPLRNVDPAIITDPDDKVLSLGGTGEEVVLELTLQVVADVGLVGLPNAGKSSLLAGVTRATPDIQDYPFTTLMPNLGQLPGTSDTEDGGYASRATLADLPGLIKGAHLGKGLGRMFLRHLRRTRLLLHVVDSSADDPIRDYKTLREELYMYNPDYVRRPHILVLNKLDLPKARAFFEANREILSNMGTDPEAASLEEEPTSGDMLPILHGDEPDYIPADDDKQKDVSVSKTEHGVEDFRRPLAVIGISAKEGLGMEELLSSIKDALERDETKVKNKPRRPPRPQMYKPPQWQL